MQEERKQIALSYFEAFHEGDLNTVFSFLAEDCHVKYGTQERMEAKVFFSSTKELISTLKFYPNAVYSSNSSTNVLIHFVYEKPSPDGNPPQSVEAIDIIKFNSKNEINEIFVIPNE